jgi:glycosyltransferase involved in cell wall biosynthesis
VAGSYPPDACGVGDYTSCLVRALRETGIDIDVLTGQDWSARRGFRLVRTIRSYGADVIHLQYPMLGFGYKLGPQLLSALLPMVVTIHEVTQAHILRRLSLYPFSLRSRRVIFTTEAERDYAIRWCPWISGKETVIPIGSNISVVPKPSRQRNNIIGYFGLIRPLKGLEHVIEAAALLHARNSDLRVRIIGKVVPGREEYYSNLRAKSTNLPIEWCIGADDAETSALIASCEFAYLPFPDGASERRASLIAFLEAGAGIVTTRGEQTPRFINDAVRFAKSPADVIEIVDALNADQEAMSMLRTYAKRAALRFSWQHIAQRHVELYASVVNQQKIG